MLDARREELTERWAEDLTQSDRQLLARLKIMSEGTTTEATEVWIARIASVERHNRGLRKCLAALAFIAGVLFVCDVVAAVAWGIR